MSAFREHFLDKYFGYRRRYVDHFLTSVPQRAELARRSEIARLGFTTFGSLACAVVFWLLVAAAAGRAGTLVAVLPLVFLLCAALPTLFAAMALGGIAAAVRDRARVADGVAAKVGAPRRE